MLDRLRTLLHGTVAASWALWTALIGAAVWVCLPDPLGLELGLFVGFFVAARLELNALRQRVERLEREAAEA